MLDIIATFSTSILLYATVATNTPTERVLAVHEMSLQNRYEASREVNEVFKDNILLNLAYMRGLVQSKQDIDWSLVREPFSYTLTLEPQEIFAYQDDVLPEYDGKVTKTTNAHFNAQEGFLSSGSLYGDGVCHLASIIHWVASDAGLQSVAPTAHDFMPIPEVPKEYGVSIYSMPGDKARNAQQNLYVKNTTDKPLDMKFVYNEDKLIVSVVEDLQ